MIQLHHKRSRLDMCGSFSLLRIRANLSYAADVYVYVLGLDFIYGV
jgi:hypothetical protein